MTTPRDPAHTDTAAQLEALAAAPHEPPARLIAAVRRERSARRTTAALCASVPLLALAALLGPLALPTPLALPRPMPPEADLPASAPLAAIVRANAEGPITLQSLRLPARQAPPARGPAATRTFRVLDRPF